jgi:hypothetical protein
MIIRITKSVLAEARALLENPAHWTQHGGYGADEDGNGADIQKACKFCMFGAIAHVLKMNPVDTTILAAHVLGIKDPSCIFHFNDDPATTHEMMLAKFDELLERAPADDAVPMEG